MKKFILFSALLCAVFGVRAMDDENERRVGQYTIGTVYNMADHAVSINVPGGEFSIIPRTKSKKIAAVVALSKEANESWQLDDVIKKYITIHKGKHVFAVEQSPEGICMRRMQDKGEFKEPEKLDNITFGQDKTKDLYISHVKRIEPRWTAFKLFDSSTMKDGVTNQALKSRKSLEKRLEQDGKGGKKKVGSKKKK